MKIIHFYYMKPSDEKVTVCKISTLNLKSVANLGFAETL